MYISALYNVQHTDLMGIKGHKVQNCGHLWHGKRLLWSLHLKKLDQLVWLEPDQIHDIVCLMYAGIVLEFRNMNLSISSYLTSPLLVSAFPILIWNSFVLCVMLCCLRKAVCYKKIFHLRLAGSSHPKIYFHARKFLFLEITSSVKDLLTWSFSFFDILAPCSLFSDQLQGLLGLFIAYMLIHWIIHCVSQVNYAWEFLFSRETNNRYCDYNAA